MQPTKIMIWVARVLTFFGLHNNFSIYIYIYITCNQSMNYSQFFHILADLALRWVSEYPASVFKDDQVLMAMAKAFPRELGLGEAFIYPCIHVVFNHLLNTEKLCCY